MSAAAQAVMEAPERFSDAELEFAARMEFTHRPTELLSLYDAAVLRKAILLLQVKLGGGAKELAKRMGMCRKSIYAWKRGEITYHSAHRVWSMLEEVWREHYKAAA